MNAYCIYTFLIFIKYNKYNHRTIIQKGITGKKIPCYMRDSLAGGVLLKKLKYFDVILKRLLHERIFMKNFTLTCHSFEPYTKEYRKNGSLKNT